MVSFASILVGCQTAQEVQQAQEQRMQSVVGLTMAEFTGQTGLTPATYYPSGSGRVFAVPGKSVTFVTPGSYGAPTVSSTSTCQILLTTTMIDESGTADSWRIKGVNWSGPCVGSW